MKTVLFVAAFLPIVLFAKTSTPEGFTDNLDDALSIAKAEGKLVYACFSGSDWCGWCMKLEREVLSKESFRKEVTNDFVLVFIDSPSNTEVLSERAKVENPKLVEKFHISGFPTALVMDGEANILAKTGYRDGGPRKYASHLLDFVKNKDSLRKDAEKGNAKARLFETHLKPYRTRARDVFRELDAVISKHIDEEQAKGLSREEIRNGVKKFYPEYAAKLKAILEELEKAEVPDEIKSLKDEEISHITRFIAILTEDSKQ